MGFFRFRRRVQILPGVHLNIGKTGLSVSAGVPGAQVTLGHTGLRETAGIPGTGLFYTHHEDGPRTPTSYRELLGVADETKGMPVEPARTDWRAVAENISELFPDDPEKLCLYLDRDGMTTGPYSIFQIVVMLANGTVTPETIYAYENAPEWKSLANLDLADTVETYRAVMRMK